MLKYWWKEKATERYGAEMKKDKVIKYGEYDRRIAMEALEEMKKEIKGLSVSQMDMLINKLEEAAFKKVFRKKIARIPIQSGEHRLMMKALIEKRNRYIENGEYTDGIDEVIMKTC